MAEKKPIQILTGFCVVSLLIHKGQTCRPDWDNKCDKDFECCSGFCHRDNPNWATGLCKPNNGPKSTTSNSPSSASSDNSQNGRGECSWYGDDNEIPPGSYTSCGHIFDRDQMTAAQLAGLRPKLPCGTRVRVTNEANGKTVDVVINDVGGGIPGRILDLTHAAFGSIENRAKGITPCSYVVL